MKNNGFRVVALAAIAVVSVSFPFAAAGAAEIKAAVAANFNGPLAKLSQLYEAKTGDTVVLSAGSSGALYAQIANGAPFDVFFSADSVRPEKLEEEGRIVEGSRFTYAIGVLALWSPKGGLIDEDGTVLQEGAFRHLAVADPQNAPYGAAAREVLSKRELWEKLELDKRLATGTTIGQTYSHIASGAADLGFVAFSQIINPETGVVEGSYWLPPKSDYAPIRQQAVQIRQDGDPAPAKAFLDWIKTDEEARAVIRSFGYELD